MNPEVNYIPLSMECQGCEGTPLCGPIGSDGGIMDSGILFKFII